MRFLSLSVVALVLPLVWTAYAETPPANSDQGETQTIYDEAVTLSNEGQLAAARPLAERALMLRERALGPRHLAVAKCLVLLGELLSRQGAYSRAEPLWQRALGIYEATLGASHPDVAHLLSLLVRLRLAERRLDKAVPLLARILALSEGRLRKEALTLSESCLGSFLDLLRRDEELLYALLRADADDPEVRRLALATALLRKGRSAEELAQLSRTVAHSLDAKDRETLAHLRALRTHLAQRSLQGPG